VVLDLEYDMLNLCQLSEEIAECYSGFKSLTIPTAKVRLNEKGKLSTGKNEYPLSEESYDSLAEVAEMPRPFFKRLDPDVQATLFNHCFPISNRVRKIGRDIRLNLDEDQRVIGFDDPHLWRITPKKVMEVVCDSSPPGLSPEKIEIHRYELTPRRIHFSCFSPQIIKEPQPNDIINGGIDLVHNLTGDEGTQILCYFRRLVCANGAIAHVCSDSKQLRARRLPYSQYDETKLLKQIQKVLTETWTQLNDKLEAVTELLKKDRLSKQIIRQMRTRFSLNNMMIKTIEDALHNDELGETNTQYDYFNAISRVATHERWLNPRQQRTLSRLAGEFSQQTSNLCKECGQLMFEEN